MKAHKADTYYDRERRSAIRWLSFGGGSLLLGVVLLLSYSSGNFQPPTASPNWPAKVSQWQPLRDLDGAPGAQCDTAVTVGEALARLGEHQVAVSVQPQEQIEREVPEGSAAYAEPTPDGSGRIVVTDDRTVLPCYYIWSTTAHEVAHIWQFRAAGTDDPYAVYGHDHAEVLADCVATLTGWPDYSPYLRQRHDSGGPATCTPNELADAGALRTWAR